MTKYKYGDQVVNSTNRNGAVWTVLDPVDNKDQTYLKLNKRDGNGFFSYSQPVRCDNDWLYGKMEQAPLGNIYNIHNPINLYNEAGDIMTTYKTKVTEQHRKASVEAAMKTVRQTDNAQHLVDAIKAFDSVRSLVAAQMTFTWKHSFGKAGGKNYMFAAVYVNDRFYVTNGRVYTWDEMVTEWVAHNVTPDDVRYVASTYPLEAF